VIEIDITPVWTIRHRGERRFDFVLVTLLQAIKESGRLTDAARRADISYRHAWNVIEKWGDFLGSPLVVMTRGRGTRLSELLAALPGYAPDRPGEVATIPDLLPWTEFREVT
jgi:putative molybdopterin biosynthesis protein